MAAGRVSTGRGHLLCLGIADVWCAGGEARHQRASAAEGKNCRAGTRLRRRSRGFEEYGGVRNGLAGIGTEAACFGMENRQSTHHSPLERHRRRRPDRSPQRQPDGNTWHPVCVPEWVSDDSAAVRSAAVLCASETGTEPFRGRTDCLSECQGGRKMGLERDVWSDTGGEHHTGHGKGHSVSCHATVAGYPNCGTRTR